jgi:hypothetical protein
MEADFQLKFSPVKSTVLRRPERGGGEHHNLVQQFVPRDSTRFHPPPLVMPPKVKLELKLQKWHDRCILETLGWFVIVTLAAYTLGKGSFC